MLRSGEHELLRYIQLNLSKLNYIPRDVCKFYSNGTNRKSKVLFILIL